MDIHQRLALAKYFLDARKRDELGLRQAALGIGICYAALSCLERGKVESPKPLTIKKICKFYGLSGVKAFQLIGYLEE